MTKDVFDCMRECHSNVRNFKPDEFPEATLTRILEAGTWAPSAGNLQPWFFYIVKNQKVKEELEQACYDQSQVSAAPVVIAVMADPARSNEKFGERGAQLYCLQDTAAAVQNILLAAEGLGIGGCWVGAFNESKVQQVLEAPPRLRAVALLCLGYCDEEEKTKERERLAVLIKMIQ